MTGILLAGGKSSRMGQNKALMMLNGKSLAERGLELLSGLFPSVAVSANAPEDFMSLGVPVFSDHYIDAGPLGGIHAALTFASGGKVFILGCDIPLMTRDVIRTIVEYPSHDPVVIARGDGFLQPMCGVYDPRIMDTVARMIGRRTVEGRTTRSCGLQELTRTVPTTIIPIDEACPTYLPGTFFNMNRQDEYWEIVERLAREQ
ncbi:MAG: molybdenum cofactor guanylyltransferase [Bacteroidetes bacterium]|nr:molybdenum cofactor guanylyltransferase [Bacteroidota bacterium]